MRGTRARSRAAASASLRVGVGRPERGDPRDVADFVLSPFEPHEDHAVLVARALVDGKGVMVDYVYYDGADARFQPPAAEVKKSRAAD